MAELRLNGEMNLLSTRYRVSSDCACRFKRQKWMVEVLRETSSDIGRIALTGHERELLRARRHITLLHIGHKPVGILGVAGLHHTSHRVGLQGLSTHLQGIPLPL